MTKKQLQELATKQPYKAIIEKAQGHKIMGVYMVLSNNETKQAYVEALYPQESDESTARIIDNCVAVTLSKKGATTNK